MACSIETAGFGKEGYPKRRPGFGVKIRFCKRAKESVEGAGDRKRNALGQNGCLRNRVTAVARSEKGSTVSCFRLGSASQNLVPADDHRGLKIRKIKGFGLIKIFYKN